MPRFSVIVPVHNVEAYLRECLTSILQQSFGDFEVLAVNDASTDNSPHILDEVAATDDRIKAIHLEQNVGLGPARNVALDVATGDYLLFVDSDDWLEEDAFRAIDARLRETDADVLIFDYARVFWDFREQRNFLAHLLEHQEPETFRVGDRKDLLELLMVAWNKAYAREFIERHGLRFPPGYYEDTPWTYPVMLLADRISTLDRVCYYYRQRRHGNILRTSSRKHFEIFEQWDRLYAFLDEHPELEDWRSFLFNRMTRHFVTILRKGEERVPQDFHREFFHRAHRYYREHVPEGHHLPDGRDGRDQWFLGRDHYILFRVAEAARRTKYRVRDSAIATYRWLYNRARKAVRNNRERAYRLFLRLPLDENLAVFAAYWYTAYACNPAAIYEKLRELAPDVDAVWVVSSHYEGRMPEGVPYVRAGGLRSYYVLARAKYLVNNVNFPNFLVKRDGSVHLQTHHGTPLKTMGLDQKRYPVTGRGLNFKKLLDRCDRWDFSLSSNRFSTEMWGRAYPCEYEHLEYGYPRNDIFYTHGPNVPRRVRKNLGISPDATVVLYAPTHREYRNEFQANLDLARFCAGLPEGHVVLARAHYFYEESPDLAELQDRGLLVDVSRHHSIERLCLASDVLVTDYSSIMFDYANLRKPIVIFADDWDTYQRVRGTYFDITRDGPGPVVRTEDELLRVFRDRTYETDESRRMLHEFADRFCEFDDGMAAERVVRRVFLGEPIPRPDPERERDVHAATRLGSSA